METQICQLYSPGVSVVVSFSCFLFYFDSLTSPWVFRILLPVPVFFAFFDLIFTSGSLSVQPWIVLTCVPWPSCIYSLGLLRPCQSVLSCQVRESVSPGPVSRQVSFYVFLLYFVCLGLEHCYFDTLSCLFLSHSCFFLQSFCSFDTFAITSSLKELFC